VVTIRAKPFNQKEQHFRAKAGCFSQKFFHFMANVANFMPHLNYHEKVIFLSTVGFKPFCCLHHYT
jgi:hypothetical protein